MNKIILAAFCLFASLWLFLPAKAQCVDVMVATEAEVKQGYRSLLKKPGKQSGVLETNSTLAVTHVFASLPPKTVFKITLESDVTSGFVKAHDYVVFSVLEDVYGDGNGPVEGELPANQIAPMVPKRCIVIPKGTKVYGLVDKANSSYPFSIPKKAKVFITVSEVVLPSGHALKISFSEPNPIRREPTNRRTKVARTNHE